MSAPLVIVGAGGFGRETLDVVEAVNRAAAHPVFDIQGILDDDPSEVNLERLRSRRAPFLGPVDGLLRSGRPMMYLIGIGAPSARQRVDERFRAAGWSAATAIHPTATIGSAVAIGEGGVICAGVQVSTNVLLGRHVHLNANATIGHDTRIDDFASINPAATVSGDVRIGRGVLVGAASVVIQGLAVGAGATVGAAACVTRDVAAESVVKGVPAR